MQDGQRSLVWTEVGIDQCREMGQGAEKMDNRREAESDGWRMNEMAAIFDLKTWNEIVSHGTSGDQVFDIVESWRHERDAHAATIAQQAETIRKLTERAERMREALEFYGDGKNYIEGRPFTFSLTGVRLDDFGTKARAALRDDNAA